MTNEECFNGTETLKISSVFNSKAHLYLMYILIFITSFLHVSVCYIHYLQGESRITYTKPSAIYKVVVYVTLVASANTKT